MCTVKVEAGVEFRVLQNGVSCGLKEATAWGAEASITEALTVGSACRECVVWGDMPSARVGSLCWSWWCQSGTEGQIHASQANGMSTSDSGLGTARNILGTARNVLGWAGNLERPAWPPLYSRAGWHL